jgi:cyclase
MKLLKKIAKWVGIVGLIFVAFGGLFYMFYVQPALDQIKAENIVKVDSNLTIYEGGGGNSGVFTSDSLVIVVDSKMDDAAEKFAFTVRNIAAGKPILLVNTHFHLDHSSGNRYYVNNTILAGAGYTPETWLQEGKQADMPNQWLSDKKNIRMGDDVITIFSLNSRVHTVGDVFVYSHKHKLLFAGDVILNKQVPSVSNGDPEGYLAAFDKLQKEYDIQKIVPGHGANGGIEILENFRQYFLDMKTAAGNASKEDELVDKYKDWLQVPMLMSSENVIDSFKKK